MKRLLIFLGVFLFSYQAKVEAVREFDIKSSVSGEVKRVNKNFEANIVNKKVIVILDDFQDRIDLENAKNNLEILKEEIKNQELIVKRKRDIYERYKNLKTKSQTEKDLKFFDYIASYNNLLNLKTQYQNLLANIKKLKNRIDKKHLKADGYLYKIYVDKGDYVGVGRLIAKVFDISKEKLTIYIPLEKLKDIKNKKVYINGKKSDFKIDKIWEIPDEKYITSYKVELIGKGLKIGDIVNIELK